MRLSPTATDRLWRILLVLGVVYALGMIVYPTLRLLDGSGDFLAFHKTARSLLHTGQITTEHGVRNYLPFFVLFMTPFGLLPAWLACALFNLLSICLLVIQPGSRDLIPNEPKAISCPLVAMPFTRPFCILLYFVLLGCNMTYFLLSYRLLRLGPSPALFLRPSVAEPVPAMPTLGDRSRLPKTSP